MTVTDPVCGMQIDIDRAAAQEDRGGWAYFFCSARCHGLFRESLERYMRRETQFGVSSPKEIKRSIYG